MKYFALSLLVSLFLIETNSASSSPPNHFNVSKEQGQKCTLMNFLSSHLYKKLDTNKCPTQSDQLKNIEGHLKNGGEI